jgi:hypothetical protein
MLLLALWLAELGGMLYLDAHISLTRLPDLLVQARVSLPVYLVLVLIGHSYCFTLGHFPSSVFFDFSPAEIRVC